MKFCQKCGKEIPEDAVVCMKCGCQVKETNGAESSTISTNAKRKPKIKKICIVFGAVVLIFGIIAAVLFVPRNLKMDDFQKTNVVTAIIKYGLPESITSNDEGVVLFKYGDKVDFYGITPWSYAVYPTADKVVFFFDEEDGYEVYRKINIYCDFEDESIGFHTFSYGDIEITTYDYDGRYVSIEIN